MKYLASFDGVSILVELEARYVGDDSESAYEHLRLIYALSLSERLILQNAISKSVRRDAHQENRSPSLASHLRTAFKKISKQVLYKVDPPHEKVWNGNRVSLCFRISMYTASYTIARPVIDWALVPAGNILLACNFVTEVATLCCEVSTLR